jgi:hypothetical protein
MSKSKKKSAQRQAGIFRWVKVFCQTALSSDANLQVARILVDRYLIAELKLFLGFRGMHDIGFIHILRFNERQSQGFKCQ